MKQAPEQPTMQRNTFRHGDTMIAVESAPATVTFDDILDATHIVADDCNEAPWENWDGWEHTAKPARQHDHATPEMQGYCRAGNRGERYIITLPAGKRKMPPGPACRSARRPVATWPPPDAK